MFAISIWKIYCNGSDVPSILLCIYCQYRYYFWHEADFWENAIKITATIAFMSVIISLNIVSWSEHKYLIMIGFDSVLSLFRWVSCKHYVFPTFSSVLSPLISPLRPFSFFGFFYDPLGMHKVHVSEHLSTVWAVSGYDSDSFLSGLFFHRFNNVQWRT